MTAAGPLLFFDHQFPTDYADLIEGRAVAAGPDETELARADAAVVGSVWRWDGARIATAPRLRVISRVGVGYDNVDVRAAADAGVTVCYTPDAPTVSTAEHTMALLLAITKGLLAANARAMHGGPATAPSSLELDGRTLGLIGLGRIGRRVAVAARSLGMAVVAFDPYLSDGDDIAELVSLGRLLALADVVSLHAPALPSTYHLISEETLGQMKAGAYLINCARGALVDQDALLAALDAGRLAGAALDVTDPEPLPAGHPLLQHPRVLITPHVASSTVAGRRRLYAQAIDNALAVLDGRPATVVPTAPLSGSRGGAA
jgi:phosphoglycerate dehydrogenase-like enzyme